MSEAPSNIVSELAEVDAILRASAESRTLPAPSEPFRNRLWEAVSSTSIGGSATIGDALEAMWSGDDTTKKFAELLTQEMSHYCYEVAMSTSGSFDCGLQLFDENPTGIYSCIKMAFESSPQSMQTQAPMNTWQPSLTNTRVVSKFLEHNAASACKEYGLTFNVIGAKSRGEAGNERS